MADIIAVASGKGGVGKSFLSSSLAISFVNVGHKVLLVDADLGGANLHNFLGYKVPPVGLYNFLREKCEVQDIITKTPVGVDFVAGSGDVLGMAHITKLERSRFVNKLRETDYSYVILDLGAGTSFNTVDFFNLAERKLLAMNSEPTSIENAYGFLKVAVYRYIERFLSTNYRFEEINKKLRNKSVSYPSVRDIINAIRNIDADVADSISLYVRNYRAGVVLNMVRYKKELNVFYGFEAVASKYLEVRLEKLGFVPYDDRVSESIRIMKPFYKSHKDSETAGCIDDVREMILRRL
jgi:flagellar biosynthesis protein FlhG